MAYSFEHAGQIVMLFGDTYTSVETACNEDNDDNNNDVVGTLPLESQALPPKLDVVLEEGSQR